MEQKQNPESPAAPLPASGGTGSGLFYKDGREIPPTHTDHGPMHLLPRQEDGSFAAYYYCSKAELYDAEVRGPPPRRYRRDGFTPERQEAFLEAVRGGASGREAARRTGISPTTAYNLYNSPDAAAFRAAWDEAARVADIVLEDTAFDRAVNGQEEIVFHKGERVGVRVKYDNKLLMQLLRARLPLKYAPLSEIEGWLRHRGIAPPPDVDSALDRLRAAEAEWGRRLPGEEAPPRIADGTAVAAEAARPEPVETVRPGPVEAVRPEPVEGLSHLSENDDQEGPSTGSARTEQAGIDPPALTSTSSTSANDNPSVPFPSSTSPADEPPAASTSSTSPADEPQAASTSSTSPADEPQAASTSSTSSADEPPAASTSSTSSGIGQPEGADAASTSSTSPAEGTPAAPTSSTSPPPPPAPAAGAPDDSVIVYRPPPRPRLISP